MQDDGERVAVQDGGEGESTVQDGGEGGSVQDDDESEEVSDAQGYEGGLSVQAEVCGQVEEEVVSVQCEEGVIIDLTPQQVHYVNQIRMPGEIQVWQRLIYGSEVRLFGLFLHPPFLISQIHLYSSGTEGDAVQDDREYQKTHLSDSLK